MKQPFNKLSNFHEARVTYKGRVFNSSEHAYQSTKFIDKDVPRFALGGDLAVFEAFQKHKKSFFGVKATD